MHTSVPTRKGRGQCTECMRWKKCEEFIRCDVCQEFLCQRYEYTECFKQHQCTRDRLRCDKCEEIASDEGDIISCPGCHKNHCEDCVKTCQSCYLRKCESCCSIRCSVCNDICCDECSCRCTKCGDLCCSNQNSEPCADKCHGCWETHCQGCLQSCQECYGKFCSDGGFDDCLKVCTECGQKCCQDCFDHCQCCNEMFCKSCFDMCARCSETHCDRCVEACRAWEPSRRGARVSFATQSQARLIQSDSEPRSQEPSRTSLVSSVMSDSGSLGSMASDSSMLSWVSASSPHCFVPESLFMVPMPGGQIVYFPAMMLREGSRVIAADHVTELEVVRKVEQRSDQITVLQAGDAIPPLETTPSHRIIVPEGRDGTGRSEVRAGELQVGDSVICSRGNVRQLTHAETLPREIVVYSLSFRPDEAVDVFLPPSEVILSRGQRGRRTRRSGMNRRAQQTQDAGTYDDDHLSIPNTAAGAYED